MNSVLKKINHDYAILLIRIMVGTVFLSEGIQKFLFPDVRGVGVAARNKNSLGLI